MLVVLGTLVRLDSPGPALYRQQRVGRHGRLFTLYKLRTMRVTTSGSLVTAASDDRVTRLGRRLRASKLDELPQLWNVIRGDMSLVGPRPEVPRYVSLWPDDLREEILSIRPGITDPVTAALRNEELLLGEAADPERFYIETLLPAKAKAYAEYVRRRSQLGDLRIMVQTFAAIVRPRSAEHSGDLTLENERPHTQKSGD